MNPPVEEEAVIKIKKAPVSSSNPQMRILYFYGLDSRNEEKIIRVWFYQSEAMRQQEVVNLTTKYPHIKIE